jgi:hypothetical protein
MTNREKQAFAALCLAKFCNKNNIYHESIKKLIEYLLSILIIESLPEWEKGLNKLEVNGLGDPLPKDLEITLNSKLELFMNLIENVVEISMVDMYGKDTKKPLNFLKNCIEIIKNENIDLSDLFNIFSIIKKHVKSEIWEITINIKQYDEIWEFYKKIYSENK